MISSTSLPTRDEMLRDWLIHTLNLQPTHIALTFSDASFRRYWRVWLSQDNTLIVMDAPPEHEECQPFVTIAKALAQFGLHVPEILAADLNNGFLLLTDLGDQHYLKALSPTTVERLYGDALGALATLQACGDSGGLPLYSQERLKNEMLLFQEWFLKHHLGLTLHESTQSLLESVYHHLIANAIEQPQVWVHRDYHSRNLMVCSKHNPGILDFQDAVIGPLTYDLVSLLRDCYIAWPDEQIKFWAISYHDLAHQMGILKEKDEESFLRWFDLMGIQRHLKAIGIFARLYHRDGKPNYLKEIPRTFQYIQEISQQYPDLQEFSHFLTLTLSQDPTILSTFHIPL